MHSRIFEISLEKIEENLICEDLDTNLDIIDYVGEISNDRIDDINSLEKYLGVSIENDRFLVTSDLVKRLEEKHLNIIRKNILNVQDLMVETDINMGMIQYHLINGAKRTDFLFHHDEEIMIDVDFLTVLKYNIGETMYIGGIFDYHF